MNFNVLKFFEAKKTPPPESFQEISTEEDLELNRFFKGLSINPDKLVGRKGLKVYDKMRNDDQVKVVQTLKKNAVLSAGWSVEPASEEDFDVEVAEFVETSFDEMDGTLDNDILEIMTAHDYGYSVTEKIFKVLDDSSKHPGKIGWHALKTRRPHFFQFRQDEFGNVLDNGIVQFGFLGGEKDLPLGKFILYSYNSEFGNPYGKSDLRAAHRTWWMKQNFQSWWAMYMERFAQPVTRGTFGPNISKEHQNQLKTLLSRLRTQTSIVVPEGVVVDFLENKKKGSASYIESIDALDLAIARALLMPSLIGMTPDDKTGSFSRAKKNFDVFMIVLERVRHEIEELMLEQVIKEIVDFNFIVEEYPKFRFLPLTEENRQQIADTWLRAVQMGAVVNRPEDENQLRALIGFEEIDEESIRQRAEAVEEANRIAREKEEAGDEDLFRKEYNRILDKKKRTEIYYTHSLNKFTPAMKANFDKRTTEHITRVARIMSKLKGHFGLSESELLIRAGLHDRSKFSKEEKNPYIWITEFYRCKKDGEEFSFPPGVEKLTRKASLHHITTNRHHPQFHEDVTEMTDLDIVEMVADWTAMALELGEADGSAKSFANRIIKEDKHKFTSEIIEKIFDTIDIVDKKKMKFSDDLDRELWSYRKPNDIESKVDFQRIKRNFDRIEAKTSEELVGLFELQKKDLLALLKRKIDKGTLTARFINKELRLKGFQKIQSTIGQFLRSSHDLGMSDLAREVGKPSTFQIEPLLPEQAIKALEDKKFWVTGLMRDDLLNDVKGALLEGLRTGTTFTEMQETINDIYTPFVGDPTAIRPDGKVTSPFRIETVIRTNLSDAYNAGRQAMAEDPDLQDFVIGWEFSEILDSRTTPISLEVDGQKIRKDDSDLTTLRYPLHFNDRGLFVPVTTDDLPVKWITKSKKDKVKRMMRGFRSFELEMNFREFVNSNIDEHHPPKHEHKLPKVNSVLWHFHHQDHDQITHCGGSASNPYKTVHVGKKHAINKEFARGHGIKFEPQWFRFLKKLGNSLWDLESGEEINVSKVPKSFK